MSYSTIYDDIIYTGFPEKHHQLNNIYKSYVKSTTH